MRLPSLGLLVGLWAGAGCPAGDDGASTSGADGATATGGATGASSAEGPSPGTCAEQTTREACLAHVGTNDIGEPAADCDWQSTYRVTLQAGACSLEEDGGACMGIAFDDTCGIEGDICEDGQSVGYAIDPDGTVRIAAVDYGSTCGFPDGLQPCHEVSGAPGDSGGDTTTSGSGEEPPECACGCEL